MDDIDHVVWFRGKKIDDMTREELIEALRCACRLGREQQRSHMRDIEVLSAVRAARPNGFWSSMLGRV